MASASCEQQLKNVYRAIKGNNMCMLRNLLESDVDVNHMSEDDSIPALALACSLGNVEAVRLLVKAGADVNIAGSDGKTLLRYTCEKEEHKPELLEILDILIENGADINESDNMGCTPLYYACLADDTKMVYRLIHEGCSVNIKTVEGDSPMKVACRNAEYWFFWKGRDTHGACCPVDPNEFAPVQIIKLLLQNGSDPGEATCLPTAVQFGAINLVKELLNYSMNVNMMDQSERSPLGCACSSAKVDASVVEMLLQQGADVNKGGGWRKQKPVIFAYAHNSVEKIRLLLSYGAEITEDEMTDLVSLSLSKSVLENPEVISPSSKELISWRLLLAAGFRPVIGGSLQGKIHKLTICSSYDKISSWIPSLLSPVHSLSECCRICIRRCLPLSIDENIVMLPLPPRLKKFLQFKEPKFSLS